MCGMAIQSISNIGNTAINKIVGKIPSVTFKETKVLDCIKWAGQHISSPQNRLILGITALLTQPFIDLYNHNVDEKTKKVSAARTVAKIIAGTSTGYFVRYGCIKAVEAFTKAPVKGASKLKSLFFPKRIANVTIKGLTKYKHAIGTYLGIAVMLFTNFLIDAPLTKILTNKFIAHIPPTKDEMFAHFARRRITMDEFDKGRNNKGAKNE